MYLHLDESAQKNMSDAEKKINTEAKGDIKYIKIVRLYF